jgi:hypothetical protein
MVARLFDFIRTSILVRVYVFDFCSFFIRFLCCPVMGVEAGVNIWLFRSVSKFRWIVVSLCCCTQFVCVAAVASRGRGCCCNFSIFDLSGGRTLAHTVSVRLPILMNTYTKEMVHYQQMHICIYMRATHA